MPEWLNAEIRTATRKRQKSPKAARKRFVEMTRELFDAF